MVEPITTGAALVGLGWAGKKILGPSFDELGDQLKIFTGERIRKIFARAEQLTHEQADLRQIPPAFALKFFQAASLSEDDDLITLLWANLLVNASKEFSQRKVLYLDILDKLSAEDAQILSELIPIEFGGEHHSVRWELEHIRTSCVWKAEEILRNSQQTHFDGDTANQFSDALFSISASWPARILGSIVPYKLEPEPGTKIGSPSMGLAASNAPYDPLIRQRLVQTFELDFFVGSQIEIEGVMATALGVEFIQNCRGSETE